MSQFTSIAYAPTEAQLREELWQANRELQDAYAQFNMVSEPELVEACVYQINALRSRCNYLLRRIKAMRRQEEFCAAAAVKGGKVCPM